MKNPNPPSPQRTRQKHYKTLARAIAPGSHCKHTGRSSPSDNPVFSQAGLRVDPNRPSTFCRERRKGKQNVWPCWASARHTTLNLSTGHGHSLSTQLLYGRHCALTEVCSNTVFEHATLQDMWQSAHNTRLQTHRTRMTLHPKQGSTLDPTSGFQGDTLFLVGETSARWLDGSTSLVGLREHSLAWRLA